MKRARRGSGERCRPPSRVTGAASQRRRASWASRVRDSERRCDGWGSIRMVQRSKERRTRGGRTAIAGQRKWPSLPDHEGETFEIEVVRLARERLIEQTL